MKKLALLLILLVAGCGQDGTLSVGLVFPPGVTRLPATTTQLRLTVPGFSDMVTTAPVAADGSFTLDTSFDTSDAVVVVLVEALDASGTVVARGYGAPESLSAYTDAIRVFMAPPTAFAAAPAQLPTAVADVGVALLPYGLLFAGGRAADGTRSDELNIYSVYSHTISAGANLPAPRADVIAIGGAYNIVYLLGGLGTGDAAVPDLYAFDTRVPPAGTYTAITTATPVARAASQSAPLGNDTYLVTGAPPLFFDPFDGVLTPFMNAPDAVGQATTVVTTVSTTTLGAMLVLSGPTGSFRYDAVGDAFSAVDGSALIVEQGATLLPSGDVIVVGGRDAAVGGLARVDAERITADGVVTAMPLLARARRQPAVAVAANVLVVAGGFDDTGAALDDAELFDATTLAPKGTTPLGAARGGAVLDQLPNESLMLAAGRDSDSGAPVGLLEIFTP